MLLFAATFQFHKGPIETYTPPIYDSPASEFQFHKGPIETSQTVALQDQHDNFNSIKVRLKLGAGDVVEWDNNIVYYFFYYFCIKIQHQGVE